MKDVSEMLCYRSVFGRNIGVLIGTIASIYIATKGIQYISKKITEKKKVAVKKSSFADKLDTYKQPSSSECLRNSTQQSQFDCCFVCQTSFSIALAGTSEWKIDNIVSCNNCQSKTCKNPKCVFWLPQKNCWQCSNCYHLDSVVYAQTYDWIFERLNQKFDDKVTVSRDANTVTINNTHSKAEDNVMLNINDETSLIPLQQRVRVRKLVDYLLGHGGSIDNVCFDQIYKNLDYLPILEHDKTLGASYENLRRIVHTIIQEVIKLSELYNQKRLSSPSSYEPKIYEDILATAVINKIVETYNEKNYENSPNIHSEGSDLNSSSHIDQTSLNCISNSRCSTELKIEYDRFRAPSMKTTNVIDGQFREKLGEENYNSSASASAHSELSDYIQNHKISLPDIEFNENDIEEDNDLEEIEQEFRLIYANGAGLGTDYSDISDNWLFRKVGSENFLDRSASSVVSTTSPVGMLVPSPTQDCPTLIGNRNADEISELSENGSDIESLHDELKFSTLNANDLPHVLVENKTLIGGKIGMNSFDQSKASIIDLLEPDSLFSEQSLNGQNPAISEAKNNLILIDDRSDVTIFNNQINHFMTMEKNSRFGQDSNPDFLIIFDSLEPCKNEEEQHEIAHEIKRNTFNTKLTFDERESCHMKNRFKGSIAEREHMKWQNAIELPNNPYSAEALQRRISQSSDTKLINIERLVDKFDTNAGSKPWISPSQSEKPIKVVLNSNRVDSGRYARDYYINDSKSASSSLEMKMTGDLNRHRTIDNDNYSTPEYHHDKNDNLHVPSDIGVVSTTETTRTYFDSLPHQATVLSKPQPIQVDDKYSILKKAIELDHLCTVDRKYFLLQGDVVTAEEYAKLSLGSETTDDSHVQESSLPHCDDSLLTTVSEESDCTAAVRVYDLNRRETKILRHDIIKRSRIPIGGESINSFDNLGNCCCETNTKERSDSPFQSKIQHFNSRWIENLNGTCNPEQSPNNSIHLNRNSRKLKMSDVQLMNDAFETSLEPKIIDEFKRKNSEIEPIVSSDEGKNGIVKAIEKMWGNERESSVCDELIKLQSQELDIKQESGEMSTISVVTENSQNVVLSNESFNKVDILEMQNVQNHEENTKNSCVTVEDKEPVDMMTSNNMTAIESPVSNHQIQNQVTNYERNYEVIVHVNEHKEKSVIEKDVISSLPSVKAIAQTFSTKTTYSEPDKLNRPKIVWRKSYNGSTNNDVNDQNGNDLSALQFNHSHHPMAPGYSITARSLSTKFRQELKNATDEGRLSPERPSSPILVPGILRNNVAFFENLRNK